MSACAGGTDRYSDTEWKKEFVPLTSGLDECTSTYACCASGCHPISGPDIFQSFSSFQKSSKLDNARLFEGRSQPVSISSHHLKSIAPRPGPSALSSSQSSVNNHATAC